MNRWTIPTSVSVTMRSARPSHCFDFAREEVVRLLGRIGVSVNQREEAESATYAMEFGKAPTPADSVADIAADGYLLAVDTDGACITAPTAKGVLNGVYDLAERMGFVFLMPGEEGEWTPNTKNGRPTVDAGEWRIEPRFTHRGVFGGLDVPPFSAEEWLRFFAKLRFNAQSHHPEDAELASTLGIRLEVGGHGMSSLLPRDLFKTKPELFRMFQPEDFNGTRMADSNMCATNPETARIVQQTFREQIDALKGVYAVHAWADDLPGGGWCMCSRCRALTASDQSVLAMNMQAAAIAQSGKNMRVPVIAYHDTIYPGAQVQPARECFLLYAPRERCYAHALDDPHCAKNRWFLEGLNAWMDVFGNHRDAHTFEYYFDQILFRGLYPFLPDVILGDMEAYRGAGIQSHMSLQVGGALLAPDYNLLCFAKAQWDPNLTSEQVVARLALELDPEHPEPWVAYLQARRNAYSAAMAVCEVPNDIYFDYRFMPELAGPFGATVVRNQATAAVTLHDAAVALETERPTLSPRAARLAAREVARARFESEDILAMSLHQAGLNGIAHYLSEPSVDVLQKALNELEAAIEQLGRADQAASRAGIPEQAYYHRFNRDWSRKEIREKIRVYRQALTQNHA